MITKRRTNGKIEILEDGQIQLREDTVIEEDGIEITRTFHRRVLAPGDDTTNENQRVRDITAVIWTPQVISDFRRIRDVITPERHS